MVAGQKQTILKLNALRVVQRRDVPLYVFGINGRLIQQFAAVQFAERDGSGELVGYQRARVERHIREIREYLATDDAILPNAIVIAFDASVTFTPLEGYLRAEWGGFGFISIPLPQRGCSKPGLIVDGQQRMSALADLPHDRIFPVVVVGFASSSDELQREQFVLVNKTKPLPRDLLNELISHVDSELPKPWRLRRTAAKVVEILRYEKTSPFYGRVRGLGSSGAGTSISQAAVIEVVEQSIRRGGVLSAFVNGSGEADTSSMAQVMSVYFRGVERVWSAAWNGSPWSSRLVHGAGIYATGRLMDVVMEEVDATRPRAVSSVEHRLARIKKRCAWTEGRWPKLRIAWNEIQNTSQDKRRLAEYLVDEYRRSS